ncbi:MAG: TIGR01620 family protein [Planktomarina sp.]|uniref:YcjF family protein n=1 Tax=Planktomarina sp. TaxID=2024851 RepID=UPI003260ACBE|nr:TIGR01620 family protein [Planktomarina sp.]
MSENRKAPLVVELPASREDVTPETAPAIPEVGPGATQSSTGFQATTLMLGRRPGRALRWAFGFFSAFVVMSICLAIWEFLTGLVMRFPALGWLAVALLACAFFASLCVAGKEILALRRLARLDHIQQRAKDARASGLLPQAQSICAELEALYSDRAELRWQPARFAEQKPDIFDADGMMEAAERALLYPLDRMAEQTVEAAARQVTTLTALMPLAVVDVIATLVTNLRMIRKIAEIYGGRSGFFGSWRLTRLVLAHVIATGAVAIGDDLIGTVAGGSVLAKFSRKFGEGVINGALTARVGVAAMQLCRPFSFQDGASPSVTGIMKRALLGVFVSDRRR